MKRIIGIYKILNLSNNKCYIGSSKNITKRWIEHKRQLKNGNHHSKVLQRAYDKYGKDNFEYSILVECEVGELIELEQKYFDKIKPEYIIHKIAGKSKGYRHTEKTKELLRQIAKNVKRNPCTEETKIKISQAKKGKKLTKEHKLKLSESHKGKKFEENHINNLKKSCNPERMRKLQKLSVEKRLKNGKKLSDERRKNISQNNSVEVVALDESNNIIYEFKSYKETAKFLKKSEITLWRYITNKKKYKNLTWMRKKDYEQSLL